MTPASIEDLEASLDYFLAGLLRVEEEESEETEEDNGEGDGAGLLFLLCFFLLLSRLVECDLECLECFFLFFLDLCLFLSLSLSLDDEEEERHEEELEVEGSSYETSSSYLSNERLNDYDVSSLEETES